MFKPMMIVLFAAALSACSAQLTPPGIEFESVPVNVEVGGSNDSGKSGKFCPPGQAKKGNC